MPPLIEYIPRLPNLRDFSLKPYPSDYSLDRLTLGVDNIRYDVLVSPTFCNATRKIAKLLVLKHTGTDQLPKRESQDQLSRGVHKYKNLFRELMTDTIHRAKGLGEPQLDNLAQTAIVKIVINTVSEQFDEHLAQLKARVRERDLGSYSEKTAGPSLKEKLAGILQNRADIIRMVGMEMFSYLKAVHKENLAEVRESNFGHRSKLFSDAYSNPMLHTHTPYNDAFLIDEYDLSLGRRMEDPDKHGNLLFQIKKLLNQADLDNLPARKFYIEKRGSLPFIGDDEREFYTLYDEELDRWIRRTENIDTLLNYQATMDRLKELKKNRANRSVRKALKIRLKHQKKLFNYFLKKFKRIGLARRICAIYSMKPVYKKYCPPLVPRQVLQYLSSPKTRRIIRKRLKRLQKMYGKSFSLAALNDKVRHIDSLGEKKRKELFMRFLKAFARYHRDSVNHKVLYEAVEQINLVDDDDKIITLSRENNTLYEFFLPHEQVAERRKIINHTIIKADVRGSTDITHLMNERGLNPASFFSLHFFDPISDILAEYGTQKVFIEGDAIILSIFEEENSPADWYAVSRACGIALNMFSIIRTYNEKSKQYQLPILELGVGISHTAKPPTFLFDGNNRIMISPAINHADRLSSCSKTLRQRIMKKNPQFNLFVFQNASEKDMAATADDLYLRYNINGIELNEEGFSKLRKEITLKRMKLTTVGSQHKNNKFFTGKFPTKSGRYQRLILRESPIQIIQPEDFKISGVSARKYYEVCTNEKIYRRFKTDI
ncbi:MAG: hypothetical protein HKM93_13210 [Desulfobacteraceae bacterium]|nr:hypothetical protein [Desulfobacteraceae bacterium]